MIKRIESAIFIFNKSQKFSLYAYALRFPNNEVFHRVSSVENRSKKIHPIKKEIQLIIESK